MVLKVVLEDNRVAIALAADAFDIALPWQITKSVLGSLACLACGVRNCAGGRGHDVVHNQQPDVSQIIELD